MRASALIRPSTARSKREIGRRRDRNYFRSIEARRPVKIGGAIWAWVSANKWRPANSRRGRGFGSGAHVVDRSERSTFGGPAKRAAFLWGELRR
jgi:hypothetical protein